MLQLLRRIVNSTVGKIVALVILVVIALAFAAGDVGSLHPGGVAANNVAKVGDEGVSESGLRERMQLAVESARQQQPSITMADFIAQGGLDDTLERTINGLALAQFAKDSGMLVSNRAVDGQIASIPAFQGPDGKFSQTQFDQLLKARNINADDLRDDIRRETLAQWLISPTVGASQVPTQLAMPYASLLLEKRHGTIGFIPTATIDAGDKPSDQQLAAYYKNNVAAYTVPERRVVRYALVKPDSFADRAKPSDAEIAQAYKAAGTRFAAKEERSIDQVVVLDEDGAKAIAAKIRGGTSVQAAAQAAGLEASSLSKLTRADMASQTSQPVADAAFSADKGAVVGPVQSPLGYVVAKVTDVTQVAGKSLAEATPEIRDELAKQKTIDLISEMQGKIDDGITDGATFPELVADSKLQAQQTQPLLESGADPDHPDQQPDPAVAKVVQAGFAAQEGDPPQLVQIGDDGTFALVALGKVVPAAPKPLKVIRDKVVRDYMADQANKKAHDYASKTVAAINKGTDMRTALSSLKLRLPAPEKVDFTRGQLAQAGKQVPPPLALMLSMAPKKAKLLEAPNNAGWFVVYLDTIDKGDAKGNDQLIKTTRGGLGRVIGQEYSQQFVDAIRRDVGVKKNVSAVAKVRADLGGGGQTAP